MIHRVHGRGVNPKRGFTVVELLVVAVIIGLLTVVVIASVSQARASARDKQRIASLEQVSLALEVYKQAYGSYPLSCNDGDGTPWEMGGHGSDWGSCTTTYIQGMSNIIDLPRDPTDSVDGYRYISDGTSYRLEAYSSVESANVSPSHEYTACASTCTTGVCARTSGAYTNADTLRTYAIWKGTTFTDGTSVQCSR